MLEAVAFEAFEFDADRIVVAVRTALPYGLPGVPGALVARDELPKFSAAANQEMR